MKTFRKNKETNELENLNLEAPWYSYCKMLQALFVHDVDIVVGDCHDVDDGEFDFGIDIEVRNHKKFLALNQLLPGTKTFGTAKVRIVIFDEENTIAQYGNIKLFETLFDGNPLVHGVQSMTDPYGYQHGFVIFRPRIIQFFDDNLGDYKGNWTGLAQDIAKEVFDNPTGVNFCTEDLCESDGE